VSLFVLITDKLTTELYNTKQNPPVSSLRTTYYSITKPTIKFHDAVNHNCQACHSEKTTTSKRGCGERGAWRYACRRQRCTADGDGASRAVVLRRLIEGCACSARLCGPRGGVPCFDTAARRVPCSPPPEGSPDPGEERTATRWIDAWRGRRPRFDAPQASGATEKAAVSMAAWPAQTGGGAAAPAPPPPPIPLHLGRRARAMGGGGGEALGSGCARG
jgi:hypothetical protein